METYNPKFARSDQLNQPWHYGSTIDCILKMEVATDFWFHILDYRHSLPKNESQTSETVWWSSRERGRHAVSVKNYEKCHCKHTLCFSDFTVIPSYRSLLYSVSSVLFFLWSSGWSTKRQKSWLSTLSTCSGTNPDWCQNTIIRWFLLSGIWQQLGRKNSF